MKEIGTRSLEGKVAIVTGSGSGIGRASAEAMARAGASVVVADIALEAAEQVVEGIVASGSRALACHADVGREADIRSMVELAVARWGRLDVLHNNAALMDDRLSADLPAAERNLSRTLRQLGVICSV